MAATAERTGTGTNRCETVEKPRKYYTFIKVTILASSGAKTILESSGRLERWLQKLTKQKNTTTVGYVLMLEHEGIRILLGGDATPESWRDIRDNHEVGALAANIFLAPHHGSSANIEKDVFKEIDPQYVVISDHYGHSYDYNYYNNLANVQVHSTKHFGNITVEVSQSVKQIYTERNG